MSTFLLFFGSAAITWALERCKTIFPSFPLSIVLCMGVNGALLGANLRCRKYQLLLLWRENSSDSGHLGVKLFYLFPRVWEDQSSSEMKPLPPPLPPLSAPYWDRGRRMPRMEIAALPSCLWCQERGNVGHSLLLSFPSTSTMSKRGCVFGRRGKNTSPWKKQVACCGTKIDVSLTSFSRRKITRA